MLKKNSRLKLPADFLGTVKALLNTPPPRGQRLSVAATIDPKVDAAYVRFSPAGPGNVAYTLAVKTKTEDLIHLDIGKDGRLMGIEVIGASTLLPDLVNQKRVASGRKAAKSRPKAKKA